MSWNFINKLWNIIRFVFLNIKDKFLVIDEDRLNVFDKWIFIRLSEIIIEVDKYYECFEFNEVFRVFINFIWEEFVNWYLEIFKVLL